MLSIPRKTFREAIAAGLDAAPDLPEKYRRRLLKLAREAKVIGLSFPLPRTFGPKTVGCPLARVRAYTEGWASDLPIGLDGVHQGWAFVNAYDRVIRASAGSQDEVEQAVRNASPIRITD